MAITNLAVNPGDEISASVWVVPGQGHFVSIENLDTFQTAVINVPQPAGYPLLGNTIEWVVERPGINNVTSNLLDYRGITFRNCIALTYATQNGPITVYSPGNGQANQLWSLKMTTDGQYGSPTLSNFVVNYIDPATQDSESFVSAP